MSYRYTRNNFNTSSGWYHYLKTGIILIGALKQAISLGSQINRAMPKTKDSGYLSYKGYSGGSGYQPPPSKKRRSVLSTYLWPDQRGTMRTSGNYGKYNQSGWQELKFLDDVLNNTVVPESGLIVNTLLLISQGTGESERIGRKVMIKKLQISLEFLLLPSTDQDSMMDICRIIVYLDKQCNGTAATASNILDTPDVLSWRNIENSHRFNILKDFNIELRSQVTGNGTTLDSTRVKSVYKIILDVNYPIEFSGTSGVISEIKSNNIGMLFLSLSGVIKVQGKIRIRFNG